MYAPYIEKTEKKKRNVEIVLKNIQDFSFSTKVVAK